MKAVTIENIESGMILAQDVLTPKGQTLLKSGIELDEYYISILTKYNVDVVIVNTQEEEKREMSDEERAFLLAKIRPGKKLIFQKTIDDPMMYELYEAVVQNELWEKWNEN